MHPYMYCVCTYTALWWSKVHKLQASTLTMCTHWI